MAEGRLPEIRIIEYLPENEAHFKEVELITLLVMAGQKLCNDTHNFRARKIKTKRNPFTIKKRLTADFLDEIKYLQKSYITRRNKLSYVE